MGNEVGDATAGREGSQVVQGEDSGFIPKVMGTRGRAFRREMK